MKKIVTLVFLLSYLVFFSQKKYYIFFDSQKDKIIYFRNNNKTLIEGIEIYLNNNKFVYFIPSDKKSDFKSEKLLNIKTITRNELSNIIKTDHRSKKIVFIIIVKERKVYKYYFMDHIFRTVETNTT